MYATTPGVANVSVALAVGAATVQVLPAAGANQCYRITSVLFSVNRLVTGITDVQLQDTTQYWPMTLDAGNRQSYILVPEPGVQLAVNTALTFFTNGTVAAGSGRVFITYVTDSVA